MIKLQLHITIALLCAGALFGNYEGRDEIPQIKEAIKKELLLHPDATLVDLYKFFHQEAFGPGHMIDDPASALAYLMAELRTATAFDSLLWQEVGYKKAYFRINLKLVQEGVIPVDTLVQYFILSANRAQPIPVASWKERWHIVSVAVEEMALGLADYERDKEILEKVLKSDDVSVHHSATYRASYHPHYRVVDRESFQQLLGTLDD